MPDHSYEEYSSTFVDISHVNVVCVRVYPFVCLTKSNA